MMGRPQGGNPGSGSPSDDRPSARRILPVVIRRVDLQLNDTESHIVVAGQPFGLVASCIHCPNVTYTWWTNTTATATSNATGPIYRNGYPLTAGEAYTFTVEATALFCPELTSSSTFVLRVDNHLLGHCIVVPTEGREYATLFSVHCSGFTGEAASIKYRYFVKINSTNYNEEMLYEGQKSSMPPQHLFAGVEQDNYTRIIYINITDQKTWIGTANISVVVRPTDCVIEDMVDHISSYMFNDTGDSVLDVLLASKDFQGGFSVMSGIANVLNHVFSATTYTAKAAEKLKKVRRMIISKLSNISDSDNNVVLGKAECLNVITGTDYAGIETQNITDRNRQQRYFDVVMDGVTRKARALRGKRGRYEESEGVTRKARALIGDTIVKETDTAQ
ncbi:hypothetical protein LSAT2_003433 [Lamellibrachia satsuma]|nr:hypothetical protein LSAT2_003433 [Lamellibrachia satsuma]